MFKFSKFVFRCVVICVAVLSFGGAVWGQGKSAPEDADKLRLVVQTGQFSYAYGIAFSPDAKLCVSSASHGAVLWDVETAKELKRVNVQALKPKFSPDSKYVLLGNGNVWDVRDGSIFRYSHEWSTGDDPGAFDRRGSIYLLSDKHLSIFKQKQQAKVGLISWESTARGLTISHDDRFAATCHVDGCIRFWDLENWQLTKTIKLSNVTIKSLDFSIDDTHLTRQSHEK